MLEVKESLRTFARQAPSQGAAPSNYTGPRYTVFGREIDEDAPAAPVAAPRAAVRSCA